MKRDKEILKGKIILYELYNNKLEKGYFSSLKYYMLADKEIVILRADSGKCYICQMVSSTASKEYFLLDSGENTKTFVNVLACGTTDEKFSDVINELEEHCDKYLQKLI